MTDAERIDDLEARLRRFEDFFSFGTSSDGLVPYVMTAGRVGVMTRFWAERPVGQGAGLSVGTAVDRFAGYFEIDPGPDGMAACPDHPSTAVYASVVAPHRAGEAQPNLAVEAHAANAPAGNLPFYGDYQYAPASPLVPTEGIRLAEVDAAGDVLRQVSASANGITLKDGAQFVTSWFVQKIGGIAKTLWP